MVHRTEPALKPQIPWTAINHPIPISSCTKVWPRIWLWPNIWSRRKNYYWRAYTFSTQWIVGHYRWIPTLETKARPI